MTAGVVVLDKEAGVSSAQAIARLKKRCVGLKIGHAGTLDPPATGILIVLIGGATRLMRFIGKGRKCYEGAFLLGTTTSTDDLSGVVLTESTALPPAELVFSAAARIAQRSVQVPPSVSALHYQGKRGYELVRDGEMVPAVARPVEVFECTVAPLTDQRWSYKIVCGGGTYVRSLIRDIGQELGCGATVATLKRTFSDPFTIEHSVSVDAFTLDAVIPWWTIDGLGQIVRLTAEEFLALEQGKQWIKQKLSEGSERCMIAKEDELPTVLYEPPGEVIWVR